MPEGDKQCPVADTAALIGNRWVLLILRDLAEGTKRFGELEKSLGINPRTLSARLAELEQEGVVARQCYAEVPPRVEYSLTDLGRRFLPLLAEIATSAPRSEERLRLGNITGILRRGDPPAPPVEPTIDT